jgi:hypothetical protein
VKRLLTVVAVTALLLSTGPSAEAATAYHRDAAVIARAGHCKNIRDHNNGGVYAYSHVICDLRGKRINLFTFVNKDQEIGWAALACFGEPDRWMMLAAGMIITAKDGNRAAARVGKNVYGGVSIQCKLLKSS